MPCQPFGLISGSRQISLRFAPIRATTHDKPHQLNPSQHPHLSAVQLLKILFRTNLRLRDQQRGEIIGGFLECVNHTPTSSVQGLEHQSSLGILERLPYSSAFWPKRLAIRRASATAMVGTKTLGSEGHDPLYGTPTAGNQILPRSTKCEIKASCRIRFIRPESKREAGLHALMKAQHVHPFS